MTAPPSREAFEGGRARPTIWVDVAGFLEFFRDQARPTGIQRVEMEIFAQLARTGWARGTIRFCRLEQDVDRFESVEFETLARVFFDSPIGHDLFAGNGTRGLLAAHFRAWRRRLVRLLRRALREIGRPYLRPAPPGPRTQSFSHGDILVCLGASWQNPRYIEFLECARRQFGVRIAVLIYDLIPITHPQWVGAALADSFATWLSGVLRSADLVMTISEYSRAMLLRFAADQNLAKQSVDILLLGTGFCAIDAAVDSGTNLRLPEHFVLYVSTIEARKNHALLLRVWRGLIAKHSAAAVPSLVFVGRRGSPIDEVISELSGKGSLSDKMIILSGLSDADVARAYDRCLFTVFPSLMEGWGLPVSESLQHGKLCVASDRGAIPEVAGDLIDYFDPDDDAGAFAAIERAIFDKDYREAREARLRVEFRPRSWVDCAATLMARLDGLFTKSEPQNLGLPASEFALKATRQDAFPGVRNVV